MSSHLLHDLFLRYFFFRLIETMVMLEQPLPLVFIIVVYLVLFHYSYAFEVSLRTGIVYRAALSLAALLLDNHPTDTSPSSYMVGTESSIQPASTFFCKMSFVVMKMGRFTRAAVGNDNIWTKLFSKC